jgi:hypothetical protein
LIQREHLAIHFTATCLGFDPLGRREKLETFANEQLLPAHVTREEAAAIVLDQFKRTVAQALATLEVRAE